MRERRPVTATATGASTSRDFAGLPDRNGNGVADPEDLILDPAYNNGVDDDHDGYVDDISGWDFLYGDNDPLDTVEYGHGTGEAEDSTAAENGAGDVGTCPKCRFLPVRVGDSFIADGGRFAAGVLFALDSGADVIQEALGAISNPPQAQQAIDAAYRRGVVVVASMADEASKHPNLPSSLEHTMAVNSVTEKSDLLNPTVAGLPRAQRLHELRRSHLPRHPVGLVLVGGDGRAAGMVGLIESIARDNHRRPQCERGHADPASDRGRHRLLDSERGRSGERLRHADRRAARHRALPDHARAGTPRSATGGSTPTRR